MSQISKLTDQKFSGYDTLYQMAHKCQAMQTELNRFIDEFNKQQVTLIVVAPTSEEIKKYAKH